MTSFEMCFTCDLVQLFVNYVLLPEHKFNNPLNYFSFQPVLYNWYNKGHGICAIISIK